MKRFTILSLAGVGLVACAPEGSVEIDNFAELELDTAAGDFADVEYDLQWDDPQYKPWVDRWAPDGYTIDIPLGTSRADTIDHATWKGESDGDRFGMSVAAGGDMNGDGVSEILTGSLYKSGSGGGDGATYMQKGAYATGDSNIGGAKGRYYGVSGSGAGEMLGSGGDIDGDGKDDFVIGGRYYDDEVETWKVNNGIVHVVLGFTRGKNDMPSGAVATIDGDKAYDYFGAGVDIVGDIDGDGNDDFVVGATGADDNGSGSGAAYLFYGPITADASSTSADATIAGESAGDAAGARIRGIGDWDGDGSDDFALGVRFEDTSGADAGAVYIITASTMPTDLGDADVIVRGNLAGSQAGTGIAGGDMSGDGYADIVVGALGHGNSGAAYYLEGPTVTSGAKVGAEADQKFSGQLAGDQFGSAVAIGDINGDDVSDVLVAANRQSSNDRGAVYGFYGPFSGGTTIQAFNADTKIVGVGSGDYFGSSVDYVESADWAYRNMVVVGASKRGSGDKGAVYLFRVD